VFCLEADVGGVTRCGERTYSDGGPGFAAIIQDLRVSGVTCDEGLVIAGTTPAGWHCTTATPVVCSQGGKRVSFVPGGDAG